MSDGNSPSSAKVLKFAFALTGHQNTEAADFEDATHRGLANME
jgi:hypothetical protein